MPESEEEKTNLEPVAVVQGMMVALVLIFLVAIALLIPGLYVKLWEWVY